MTDLEIFPHGDNLCSIGWKGGENLDVSFFSEILDCFLNMSGLIVIYVVRPYYSISNSMKKIEAMASQLENLEIQGNYFSFFFSCKEHINNSQFIELCTVLWLEYENPSFYFFSNSIHLNINRFLEDSEYYKKVIESISYYKVFHTGWEENTVWVEKYSKLEFPDWYNINKEH